MDPTFSTLEKIHTYKIYMNNHFRTRPFRGQPVITAIFINYKDDKRIARMRIVEAENIKDNSIRENEIHEFNINDFRRDYQIVDISTPYSLNARRAASSALYSMIFSKVDKLPTDLLQRLKEYGGKKSKGKKSKGKTRRR